MAKGKSKGRRGRKPAGGFISAWSGWISGRLKSLDRVETARLAILGVGMLVILFYAFSAGGYFLIRRSYGELMILYLLVLGILFNIDVRGRLPLAGRLEMGLMGAYAIWVLFSVTWSYIPARSFEEFTRAVLYLAGFALFYLYFSRREWLEWLGHAFILIAAAVAVNSMLGKVIPDVITHPDIFESNRLNYPLTYWNTMALLMAMAFPVALRAAASRAAHPAVRCLYAAALVLFSSVLFFTFSRAGIVLLVLTLAVYLAASVSRLKLLLHAGLAILWTIVIVGFCYLYLPAMVETTPDPVARISEGHLLGVALVVVLLAAAATQVAVWRLEGKVSLSARTSRKVGMGLAAAGVVVVLAGSLMVTASEGGPVSWLRAQVEFITAAEKEEAVERAEERLMSLQSGRYQEYAASLGAFTERPLQGTGAGTWSISWFKNRPYDVYIKDGHSLLFENMVELGLVGTLLLFSFIGVFIVRCVKDLRFLKGKRERDIYAAFLAACSAFLMHAMIDWDWEMPVVTLAFFMFAGALLRYGVISRRLAVGEGEEESSAEQQRQDPEQEPEREGFGLRRALSWKLLAGTGCIVAMVAVIFPLLSQVRVQSAGNYARANDAANLEREARLAHRLFPLDATPLIMESIANSSQGRMKKAEDLLNQALELEPKNDRIYRELTEFYLQKQDVDKAAEMVKKSRELNPRESKQTPLLEGKIYEMGGNPFENQ